MLETRVGSGTSHKRHVILPVFARYFNAVSIMANDIPVDREHGPSVVSRFNASRKHGFLTDIVLNPSPLDAHKT
jgi:hypothetical protein